MFRTAFLPLAILTVLPTLCHSNTILYSSRQRRECSTRDFIRFSRPNRQSRSICKRYQFLLFATAERVCFRGTVNLLPRNESCDTAHLLPPQGNQVICSLGKYILPRGNTELSLMSNYLCNPRAPSYLFRVTHPGTIGTTDVVMKFEAVAPPSPIPPQAPHQSAEPLPEPPIAPVQPFAPSVIIKSTKNVRKNIIQAALRRVRAGGLAWSSLISKQQVSFTIEKIKKFKYQVFFNFHKTFQDELPILGINDDESNATVTSIALFPNEN